MSEIITNAKCSGVYVGDRCGQPIPDYDADQTGPSLCEQCQAESDADMLEQGEAKMLAKVKADPAARATTAKVRGKRGKRG